MGSLGGTTPPVGYVEQICPLLNNQRQSITNVAADLDFVASNTYALSGLLSTVNDRLKKAFLVVQGVAVNKAAAANNLDGAGGTENILKINLDGGAYSALSPSGQFSDLDLQCAVGANHAIFFIFDISTILAANVDGKIGIQWAQAKAAQNTMVVTLGVYAKLIWRL